MSDILYELQSRAQNLAAVVVVKSRLRRAPGGRRPGSMAWGAFWGTRMMEIVKKHDSGGLVWKRIKLTTTRKANAKKRIHRVWQNEAVLRACSESPSNIPLSDAVETAHRNPHEAHRAKNTEA